MSLIQSGVLVSRVLWVITAIGSVTRVEGEAAVKGIISGVTFVFSQASFLIMWIGSLSVALTS